MLTLIHAHTHIWTTEAYLYYKLTNEPKGSGELKTKVSKTDRLRITKGNNSKRIGPYFSIINVHLVDINVFAKFYEIPSLPFQDIEKPKRRGRINGWMNVHENNIPHLPDTNTSCPEHTWTCLNTTELPHDKTNKMTAPSEDSRSTWASAQSDQCLCWVLNGYENNIPHLPDTNTSCPEHTRTCLNTTELPHDKTNKMTAPSEDSRSTWASAQSDQCLCWVLNG